MLAWGNEAYPSLVRNMFASISNTHVNDNTCSFTISFLDRDEVITPKSIGSIIGVPCTPNGITFVSDSLSEEERRRASFELLWFSFYIRHSKTSSYPLFIISHLPNHSQHLHIQCVS